MRIIAGSRKGARIFAPKGAETRPTGDRVREAAFNLIGPGFTEDAKVLDAFAGSGALGLEALSRGAAHATFLDKDAAAIKLIGDNLRKLGETGVAKVVRADATRPPPAREGCDLVFLDPPYRSGQAAPAL